MRLKKGNKLLTFGRITLKDPWSQSGGQYVLRPILVVLVTRVVCDMNKGTIWEFENARWLKNPAQLPLFLYSNPDDAEKRLGFHGEKKSGLLLLLQLLSML